MLHCAPSSNTSPAKTRLWWGAVVDLFSFMLRTCYYSLKHPYLVKTSTSLSFELSWLPKNLQELFLCYIAICYQSINQWLVFQSAGFSSSCWLAFSISFSELSDGKMVFYKKQIFCFLNHCPSNWNETYIQNWGKAADRTSGPWLSISSEPSSRTYHPVSSFCRGRCLSYLCLHHREQPVASP